MTPLETPEGFKYYENIKQCSPEFTPIKCTNLLCFYKLDGRKSIITKDSLVPLIDVQYVVSAPDGKFYLKSFKNYTVGQLFFYYNDKNAEVDESIETLRRYVYDGNVWLLFDKEMIDDMKAMLLRVYKGHITGEGTMLYADYILLAEQIVRLEDFKRCGDVTGSKTVINQFTQRINEIWNTAHRRNNPPKTVTV